MKYDANLDGWIKVEGLTPAVYRSGPIKVRPGGEGSLVTNEKGAVIADIPKLDRLSDDIRAAGVELLATEGKDDLDHVVCVPTDLVESHVAMMLATKPEKRTTKPKKTEEAE